MPQMSPMNWMLLYVFFLLILFLFNMLIYFMKLEFKGEKMNNLNNLIEWVTWKW